MGLVSFERSGSFLVGNTGFVPLEIEYLVIAGGGSGTYEVGGGGGAGGYRSSVVGESSGGGASAESVLTLETGTDYTVTVGAGGATPNQSGLGNNGNNSVFASITSIGGGTGGQNNGTSGNQNGTDGGSGGGGAGSSPMGVGGSGTANQGFDGGDATTGRGGGGGASAAGQDGQGSNGGDGGDGVSSSITGSAITRAGGGGGGSFDATAGAGGLGGGGNGGTYNPDVGGQDGTVNTGGGGGAGGNNQPSGSGGSGVVILRYPASVVLSTASGLIGRTTTVGQNKVTQITAGTGTISFTATGAEAFPEYPAFLDSAPVWLDASDASTITESGGSVSQWSNKGTLDSFTQASSTFQPTTSASTINSLNVLDFNRNAMQYSGNKADFNFMHNGTSFFVIYVMNFASNEIKEFLCNARGTASSTGFHVVVDGNNNNMNNYIFNGSGSATALISETRATTQATAIYSINFDPDNGTASSRAESFVNASTGLTTNTQSASPSSSDPFTEMIIGCGPDTGGGVQTSTAFLGQVAEMIVVSGADATEANRQTVVNYLNSKWGIF